MRNYIYITTDETVWVNDSFETVTFPTVIEVKEVAGEITADNHHLMEGTDLESLVSMLGKIYIDGEIYDDPSQIQGGTDGLVN